MDEERKPFVIMGKKALDEYDAAQAAANNGDAAAQADLAQMNRHAQNVGRQRTIRSDYESQQAIAAAQEKRRRADLADSWKGNPARTPDEAAARYNQLNLPAQSDWIDESKRRAAEADAKAQETRTRHGGWSSQSIAALRILENAPNDKQAWAAASTGLMEVGQAFGREHGVEFQGLGEDSISIDGNGVAHVKLSWAKPDGTIVERSFSADELLGKYNDKEKADILNNGMANVAKYNNGKLSEKELADIRLVNAKAGREEAETTQIISNIMTGIGPQQGSSGGSSRGGGGATGGDAPAGGRYYGYDDYGKMRQAASAEAQLIFKAAQESGSPISWSDAMNQAMDAMKTGFDSRFGQDAASEVVAQPTATDAAGAASSLGVEPGSSTGGPASSAQTQMGDGATGAPIPAAPTPANPGEAAQQEPEDERPKPKRTERLGEYMKTTWYDRGRWYDDPDDARLRGERGRAMGWDIRNAADAVSKPDSNVKDGYQVTIMTNVDDKGVFEDTNPANHDRNGSATAIEILRRMGVEQLKAADGKPITDGKGQPVFKMNRGQYRQFRKHIENYTMPPLVTESADTDVKRPSSTTQEAEQQTATATSPENEPVEASSRTEQPAETGSGAPSEQQVKNPSEQTGYKRVTHDIGPGAKVDAGTTYENFQKLNKTRRMETFKTLGDDKLDEQFDILYADDMDDSDREKLLSSSTSKKGKGLVQTVSELEPYYKVVFDDNADEDDKEIARQKIARITALDIETGRMTNDIVKKIDTMMQERFTSPNLEFEDEEIVKKAPKKQGKRIVTARRRPGPTTEEQMQQADAELQDKLTRW